VAEDVVVALEAVEVVEDERPGPALLGVQRLAEVAHELAAVAQAGQRVGERLRAGVGEHREVREERHAEAAR